VTKVYLDFVKDNPHKSMCLVHLLSYRDDREFENTLKAFINDCIEGVRRVLESAKRKGRLKSGIDPYTLAGIFVNQYFTVVSLKELMEPELFTDETFFKLMKDMLNIE